ncbi:hypothetical protein ACFFRR_007484 [Megaselia abdita]
MALLKIGVLLVTLVVFGSCDELDDLKYALPEDLGMPGCFVANQPCQPEDWKKSEKHIKNYIEDMVKQFLREEVKVPKVVFCSYYYLKQHYFTQDFSV